MNCNSLFRDEGASQTLHDIVAGQWGLGVITVTEERSAKLYDVIERLLSSSKPKR